MTQFNRGEKINLALRNASGLRRKATLSLERKETVTKYLDSSTFQVGGYSRAYADNWSRIFGKAAAELRAQKDAAPAEQTPATQEVTSTPAEESVALDVFAPAAENTYEKP